jgi:hypothetical protein
MFRIGIIVVLLLVVVGTAAAGMPKVSPNRSIQTEAVVVPDITGLNEAEAAAELNRNRLALGRTGVQLWNTSSPAPINTVGSQSVAPGTEIEAGSAIDIEILRQANALVIFDDNDLTLVNNAGVDISLEGIRFTSLDGNTPTSFLATEWGDTLRANRCMQMWSVQRGTPKGVEECNLIQRNRSILDANMHFWTGSNGATQFSVSQGAEQRAICNIANGRCAFYLDARDAVGNVPFVYFAYTTDSLILMNRSEDLWLRMARLVITNKKASPEGIPFEIGQPGSYGNPEIVARLNRLAPQQCILFTTGAETEPPEACDVIHTATVSPETNFWGAAFDVDSMTDELPHSCPAATPNRLTICVMPR